MAAQTGLDLAAAAEGGPIPAPRDLLRFITCGSVDDGKSTLIGRLLFDTGQLADDQISALKRDSERPDGAHGLDLALALDGLSAEREQGITIDVAYRFFSTAGRSFVVADTPGHEQYTRNMATGASTADAAVLLVDARKGLSTQTLRHSLIVSTLGIRRVTVAINKMDLVDWSPEVFARIMGEYRDFAGALGFESVVGIPMSAKHGDNVTRRSTAAEWYDGPDLLAHLEAIDVGASCGAGAFRLPVQWVNRPHADFRGFAGVVTGAGVTPGQRVVVLPSGERTRVERIVTYDGDLAVGLPDSSVTLTLADEVDVSRGSVIADADAPPALTERIEARLFWMANAPLRPGASCLLWLGPQSATASVASVDARIDLVSAEARPADRLDANDLGRVTLLLDRPVAADPYASNRELGAFILIDRETLDTVGMGLVLEGAGVAAGARQSASAGASGSVVHWLATPFAAPWRSALKTATWRLAGTILTVAAAWWLTASLETALLLGLFELVVKFALQFGHERLWTRIGVGLRGHALPASSNPTST